MAGQSRILKSKSRRNPAQNALLGLLMAFVGWLVLSAWPTQWFAAQVRYDPNLGEWLWAWPTWKLYFPTDWLKWGWRLADYPPLAAKVKTMTMYGYFTVVGGFLVGVVSMLLLSRFNQGKDDLHGSAHWADTDEVDHTGFMASKGRPVDGAMVGSVMLDSKKQVIHPLHPKYEKRYSPVKIPGKGLYWFANGDARDDFMRRLPDRYRIQLIAGLVASTAPGLYGAGAEQLRNKDGVPEVTINTAVVRQVEFLRDDNPAHILAFAPTRSGKGVGLVLPTLLTWRHSVLVNDIKGENWALSAGWRRSVGQIAIKFEPACQDGSTARWNPLDEIRKFTPNDVQDAQTIMNMVCDPKGEGLEDHWAKTSWEFLTGLSLHMVYAEKDSSIPGIAKFLGSPRWETETQIYEHMMNSNHDPDANFGAGWVDDLGSPTRVHPVVANAAKTMLNKEDKERTSVLSTAKSFLSLFLDPIVAQNTSTSDFSVRDLMNMDKPVSCYYIVQPGDLERMVSLTRLFFAMVIRRNATDMQFAAGTSVKGYKHRLLLLIDELPALRKLTVLQEGLGYIAGYGIKAFLICQNTIQLKEAYGDHETILAGCHVRIGYAPNEEKSAEQLAALTGKTTIIEENQSFSHKRWGINPADVSISTSKTERDLMTAAEFLALSAEDMVIFVAGRAPIYGKKIKYYEDRVMLKRAKVMAPVKSDVTRVATGKVDMAVEEPAHATNLAVVQKIADQVKQAVEKANGSEGEKLGEADGKGALGGWAPKPKPKRGLSPEEEAEILKLVQNTALVENVMRVSAF